MGGRHLRKARATFLLLMILASCVSIVIVYAPPEPTVVVLTDMDSYPQTESLIITAYGGTSFDIAQIQINGPSMLPVWANQTFFDGDGIVQINISIPTSWSVGEYTIWVRDFTSELVGNTTFIVTSLVSEPVEFSLNVTEGWNLISLPVTPDSSLAAEVLWELDWYVLVAWNGSGYVLASSFESGQAYWLLVLEDVNLTIQGIPVDEVSLNLTRGWDMVGGPNEVVLASTVFPGFHELIQWEDGYYLSNKFKPGKGYWALVLQNTTITIP